MTVDDWLHYLQRTHDQLNLWSEAQAAKDREADEVGLTFFAERSITAEIAAGLSSFKRGRRLPQHKELPDP